jgi:hypothetical protein
MLEPTPTPNNVQFPVIDDTRCIVRIRGLPDVYTERSREKLKRISVEYEVTKKIIYTDRGVYVSNSDGNIYRNTLDDAIIEKCDDFIDNKSAVIDRGNLIPETEEVLYIPSEHYVIDQVMRLYKLNKLNSSKNTYEMPILCVDGNYAEDNEYLVTDVYFIVTNSITENERKIIKKFVNELT